MTDSGPEYQNIPSIHIDTHFAQVPDIEEVQFDPIRCASLLARIGIAETDMDRVHIYLRPDYKLAYTREERKAARKAASGDYSDAGSCEVLGKHSPYGNKGDVLIAIIYGSGYGPNKLLAHEGVHAREMLKKRNALTKIWHFISLYEERHGKAEEAEADRVMKDTTLAALRKGVIQVKRRKSHKEIGSPSTVGSPLT